jgi:2,3-bisphosphoglycerate-dependent phosphoglycerate mutase
VQRVALVRHCESSGQAPEAPLTETGRAQAVELAQRLEPLGIDHVLSSPYARARATIEPFAARSGLFLHIDDRLAERSLSPEPIDAWREVVRRSFEDLDFRSPGGESGRETLARGWAAIDPSFGYDGWQSLRNPDLVLLERTSGGTLRFERA